MSDDMMFGRKLQMAAIDAQCAPESRAALAAWAVKERLRQLLKAAGLADLTARRTLFDEGRHRRDT